MMRGMSSRAPTVADLRQRPTVTVAQAAAVLGIASSTAYRLASDGRLPSVRVGGSVRIPSAHLLDLLETDQ